MDRQRLIEASFALAIVLLVAIGCFVVLRPFASALMWAVILCYASWPLYVRLERALKGRRTTAAVVMTFGVATILVLPFVIVGISLADNVTAWATEVGSWFEGGLPAAPGWLAALPLVGEPAAAYWNRVAASPSVLQDAGSFLVPVRDGVIAFGVTLGRGTLELAFSVFIAFFIFRRGTELAEALTAALTRMIGARARQFLDVAGGTITGVVYGILGTALAQGILGGLGFLVVGVPGALFLGLLTFFLSLVPMGPPLVWIPAVVWLFAEDRYAAGVFLAIWGLFVISGIDNIIKPYLISRGSQLPFVLVFLGVIGGVLAFGFIGVFLGPVLLALGFTLITAWARGERIDAAAPTPAVQADSNIHAALVETAEQNGRPPQP